MGTIHTDGNGNLITIGGNITETAPPPTIYFTLTGDASYDGDIEKGFTDNSTWVRLSDLAENTSYRPPKTFFTAGDYALVSNTANGSGITTLKLDGRNDRVVQIDLENLDFKKFPFLTTLSIRDNGNEINIGNVDFQESSLETLYMSGSSTQNPNVTGDIANFKLPTSLINLSVGMTNIYGNIEDLDVTGCPSLKVFQSQTSNVGGDIGLVDLSGCPNLENFVFTTCNIGGNIANLDVTQNPALKYIYLYLTQISGDITTLDISNNPALQYLHFSKTQISGDIANLDITNNPALNTLNFEKCHITGDLSQVDFSNSSNLTYIYLDCDYGVTTQNSITYSTTGGGLASHQLPTNVNIDLGDNGLTSAMVDNILIDLATANRDGSSLNLRGAGVPSAAGLAAKTTLETPPLSWNFPYFPV